MTDEAITRTPEQAALDAEEEAQRVRSTAQRVAAGNARLLNALHSARGTEIGAPGPLDMTPMYEMAARATGMSVEELKRVSKGLDLATFSQKALVGAADPRAAARRRAEKAGAPEKHIRHVIDADPKESDALKAVRGWLQERDGGVFNLSGGVGTHKTGSSCWALGQIDGGEFVEADDLLDVKIHERDRFNRIRRARVVVLDELGGKETLDDKGQALRLFNKLWNAWAYSCAHVFVTTNLDKPTFCQLYGERVYDRQRECGRWLTVGGESMRKPRGKGK